MTQNLQLSLNLLLTGLIVVFAVLVFLTYVIKGYGSAINALTHKNGKKENKISNATTTIHQVANHVQATETENEIPQEVVAAIAAAVDYMYGSAAYKIKSVKRVEKSPRSVWHTAGLLENTRPF